MDLGFIRSDEIAPDGGLSCLAGGSGRSIASSDIVRDLIENAAEKFDDGSVRDLIENAAEKFDDGSVRDLIENAAEKFDDGSVRDLIENAAEKFDDGSYSQPLSARDEGKEACPVAGLAQQLGRITTGESVLCRSTASCGSRRPTGSGTSGPSRAAGLERCTRPCSGDGRTPCRAAAPGHVAVVPDDVEHKAPPSQEEARHR
ncbi:hypothetical protein THAOC_34073, partial [Thalassiosira oceanica]